MKFTDAHAPGPLCHVSRYGLLTGRYPWRAEFKWSTKPVIEEGQETVASLLKGRGYATAMVGKWHLGFHEKGKDEDYTGVLKGGPADRGFESYFGIRASTDIPPYFYLRGDRAVKPPSERNLCQQHRRLDEHSGQVLARGRYLSRSEARGGHAPIH